MPRYSIAIGLSEARKKGAKVPRKEKSSGAIVKVIRSAGLAAF